MHRDATAPRSKSSFRRALSAAATIVACLSLAASAAAQVTDHLTCHRVRDPIAPATYRADLDGLFPQAGCLVKVPAQLLCVETATTAVTPPPPGAAPGPAARRFLCYKAKCPKSTLPAIPWTDQFGARPIQALTTKMVCAPESTPVTTTTTTSATTTTTNAPCSADAGGCAACGSTCGGNGVCHASGGGGGCGTIDSNPQCVDSTSCSVTGCDKHQQCGAGQVCVVSGGTGLCCNACP
jgi:hypothetical protein